MRPEELASRIDLTLLRPDATRKDVEDLLRDAQRYPFASVCIPPCYVGLAKEHLRKSAIRVCTVVGFPFGYVAGEVKLSEAIEAAQSGADEIDMVMNISAFRSGDVELVRKETAAIVSALNNRTVKLIIETCYLTEREKVLACETAVSAGAHFVKTSTGFGPAGAKVEDVRLLVRVGAGRIKVKAAGGINTPEKALQMIEAGAERIGTSSGLKIVEALL